MTATNDINEFITKGGVRVRRTTEPEIYEGARMLLVDALDSHRGVLLSSDFEYPADTRAGTWGSLTHRSNCLRSAGRPVSRPIQKEDGCSSTRWQRDCQLSTSSMTTS